MGQQAAPQTAGPNRNYVATVMYPGVLAVSMRKYV